MSRKARKYWSVQTTCDGCEVEGERSSETRNSAEASLREDGWRLGKRDLCPNCSGKGEKKDKIKPRRSGR
jgi:hypothetical protein